MVTLVHDLRQQAEELDLAYEIRVYDDGSEPAVRADQQPLHQLPDVVYRELKANHGRARIRNRLAREARYEHLLFMDGDSGVVRPDFLLQYTEFLHRNVVVCGGRTYSSQLPQNRDLHLHWTYGRKREVRSAELRRRDPWHGFQTNNFMASKSILNRIPFDETILQYGHEDTLFGQQLREARVPVLHIDNPLEHRQLEPVAVFLMKTARAVENLNQLRREHPQLHTRLTRLAEPLRAVSAHYLLRPTLQKTLPRLERYFHRGGTSLWLLDLYKLAHYI